MARGGIGVQLHGAEIAVHGARGALVHVLHDVAAAHHGRNAAAARHDRAVRRARTDLGDESAHHLGIQQRHKYITASQASLDSLTERFARVNIKLIEPNWKQFMFE